MGGSISKVVKALPIGSLLNQKNLDSLRGKYKVPGVKVGKDYKVNERSFANSGEQNFLNKTLKRQATGGLDVSNSIAQQQLQQATNRNLSQLAGTIAGVRGPNQALGLRAGMQQQAAAQQEASGQSATLRAQEYQQAKQNQLASQQQYANELARGQAGGQDLQRLKSSIAGAGQTLRANTALSLASLQAAANQNQSAQTKDLISSGASAAATIFGSDKKIKTKIKPAQLEELMSKINATKYEYKNPNGESYQDGTVLGVIAQDLEKSELGKEMVSESPTGKQVDMKKVVPTTLAAVSEIMKRLKKLEKKV